jgi:manganese transport protein
LIRFTGDRKKMGDLANPRWLSGLAYFLFAVIVGLNGKLVWSLLRG